MKSVKTIETNDEFSKEHDTSNPIIVTYFTSWPRKVRSLNSMSGSRLELGV